MESLEFFTEPVMGVEFSVKMVDGRYNVYDYSRDNETGKWKNGDFIGTFATFPEMNAYVYTKISERKNKK